MLKNLTSIHNKLAVNDFSKMKENVACPPVYALSLLGWATSSKARERVRFGISALYSEPGMTMTRVALSSFFTDDEPPLVTSEEPIGEVDQEAPELLRVWREVPSGRWWESLMKESFPLLAISKRGSALL